MPRLLRGRSRLHSCRQAVWLEHRFLLGDHSDMDNIAEAVAKIYECRDKSRVTSGRTR
ncbi:MAG: hypothetical protein ABFD60_04565 [Bryobacteraceae bacterium]